MSSKSYLSTGRINQKHRTMETILQAAADLIRLGKPVSVADAADLAKVGRTTAYRYFQTSESLLANAALWKVTKREERDSVALFAAASTPAERIAVVVGESDRSTSDNRNEYRAMLRAALETGAGRKRAGFRFKVIKDSLSELKSEMSAEQFEKTACALSLTVGIEAQLVLEDICRLNSSRARQVKLWAAQKLLEAAIAECRQKKDQKHSSR
jgi:AcrR family transcriptional regulator